MPRPSASPEVASEAASSNAGATASIEVERRMPCAVGLDDAAAGAGRQAEVVAVDDEQAHVSPIRPASSTSARPPVRPLSARRRGPSAQARCPGGGRSAPAPGGAQLGEQLRPSPTIRRMTGHDDSVETPRLRGK